MKVPPSTLPQFSKSRHHALQQYISYYYFSHSEDDSYSNAFYFYPHYKTTISIYQGAKAEWTQSSSHTVPVADKSQINYYHSSILKNRFSVKTSGSYKKIGIVFNPLGFNQFIEGPRLDIAPNQIAQLHCFGLEFEHLCSEVFATSNIDDKTALLDSFFQSVLNTQRNELAEKAIELAFDLKTHRSVEDLANTLDIDRKTLYKLFKNHLCCAPSAFRRVIMFRKAVEQYVNTDEHIKLCELAYDNYFYDQAHFIRTTEGFTKKNPKQFFKGISKIGPADTYWTFGDKT